MPTHAQSQPEQPNWRHLERLRNQWLEAQEEAARLATNRQAMEDKLAEELQKSTQRKPARPVMSPDPDTLPSTPIRRARSRPRPQACCPAHKGLRVILAVYKPGWLVYREYHPFDIPTLFRQDALHRAQQQARKEGWRVAYHVDITPIENATD